MSLRRVIFDGEPVYLRETGDTEYQIIRPKPVFNEGVTRSGIPIPSETVRKILRGNDGEKRL